MKNPAQNDMNSLSRRKMLKGAAAGIGLAILPTAGLLAAAATA